VGEELVIGGHVRLTILAVEASKVVFGIAAEPKDGRRRQFLQNGPSLAGAVLIVEDDFIQRALLKCLLFAGLRVGTLLRLDVKDFHDDEHDPTLRVCEKGQRRRTIGLNVQAARALREYIEKAGLTGGPLFRPRLNARNPSIARVVHDPHSLPENAISGKSRCLTVTLRCTM
jgi:integrase